MLLAATVAVAGCSSQCTNNPGQSDTETAKGGSTLVISALVDPDTLDLQKTSWLSSANSLPYDPLLTRDMNGKVVPGLAEKYEVSEDGKVWTFTLRKDIRFHSGEPITASTVKESFERMLEVSPIKSIVGPIEKVEAVDEQTFNIHFSSPFAPFVNVVISGLMPLVDSKKAKELGDGFGDNPSGTGPLLLL